MKQKHKLRTAFLELFIQEIIKNIKPSQETIQIESPRQFANLQPSLLKPDQPHHVSLIPSQKTEDRRIIEAYAKPKVTEITPKTEEPIQIKSTRKNIPIMRPPPGALNLGKINFLLYDPKVESIECLGENKNIIVRKSGIIQTTPYNLTKQEIQKVINEFSTKTRIPLVGGMFKAAFQNLIMTAVTSQYSSGRFLIQKKRLQNRAFY